MPMKLDKETVVKHQFWFLLGGYMLIWLIAVLVLKFTAPDRIADAKNKYGAAAKAVDDGKRIAVNKATYLPPWEKEADAFDKHKGVIWKQAWDHQWRMYDWPDKWLGKYNGMFTPQTPISTDDLDEYRHKLYPEQIKGLRANAPRWIEPVELQGGFDNIFKPRTKEDWAEVPTREEVWLAQEDIWVKREALVTVYDAMARQAIMLPQEIAEPNPDAKNIKARYRFANKNWEITLHIRTNKDGLSVIGGDSTIKNIHPSGHPQPLTSAKGRGIWFNVLQDKVRARFEVRGEPVSWQEKRPFSMDKDDARSDYEPLPGFNWDPSRTKEHPILVSQGFDQSNCPIRRINAVELGQQDCRTSIWSLQPNYFLEGLDAQPEDASKAADANANAGGMAGGDQQAMMMQQQDMMKKQMMGGMGGGMGGGQASKQGNETPNNHIERSRYLQPKDQDKKLNPPSRHLPLALQLIVEQAHMHDVLVALANSRLRFQITQAEFRHVTDYVPQTDTEKKGEKDAPSTGNTFMGPMPGMGGGGGMQNQMMRDQMLKQQQMMGGTMMGGGGQDRMALMKRQQEEQMRIMGGGGGKAGGSMPRPPSSAMMMQNPMAGMGGPGGKSFSPGSRGSLLPQPTGASSSTKATEENQSDDNLVELTVYGIATLYRFPDQPKTTEQQTGQTGATPAADAAPQTQGTPPASTPATPANGTAQPAANTTQTSGAPTPSKDQPKPAGDAKQADKAADKQPPAANGGKR